MYRKMGMLHFVKVTVVFIFPQSYPQFKITFPQRSI